MKNCQYEQVSLEIPASTLVLLAPQAATVSPTAKMFLAAFKSLSKARPQFSQTYVRSFNVIGFTDPHPEHILVDGVNRGILTNVFPYHKHLYSNILRNELHPTSAIAKARLGFFIIPVTFKVSTAMRSWFLTKRVERV